ncbi:MAG: hypothetical protein V1792_24975 [Pseudomonadota bacterium]
MSISSPKDSRWDQELLKVLLRYLYVKRPHRIWVDYRLLMTRYSFPQAVFSAP